MGRLVAEVVRHGCPAVGVRASLSSDRPRHPKSPASRIPCPSPSSTWLEYDDQVHRLGIDHVRREYVDNVTIIDYNGKEEKWQHGWVTSDVRGFVSPVVQGHIWYYQKQEGRIRQMDGSMELPCVPPLPAAALRC
jgi:hypothetical protein